MKIVKGKKSPGVVDARQRLISKSRASIKDARDTLVKKAKSTDAREKLEKIRHLKNGKLEVKKSANGGITITTTKTGKLLLTTSKKKSLIKNGTKASAKKDSRQPAPKATKGGRITKAKQQRVSKETPLTRTIRGQMTESARLDYELMNTRVDPAILKRTVRQNVARERSPIDSSRFYRPMSRRSPELDYYESRSRLRSPLTSRSSRYAASSRMAFDRDRSKSPAYEYVPSTSYGSSRSRRYDFDEPRRDSSMHNEMRSRRMYKPEESSRMYPRQMTSGSSGGGSGGSYVSPLQGAKVVVGNLHNTVTQEDIVELFGDVGPLKRVKVVNPGTAEVVFVNRDDALKAVETYHNRQLDGKAMKCQLIGAN
eukprot:TRINITY_DN642_c0_g1_i2.p1 TRINITY_DN642_c0_g1~~TRINITY_DN642_c0_g1_i2.p1  ORF type:complete len:368 (+),score=96.49 TRINITY_DN642_c0_g1_i2:103-1206(+)